MNRTVHIERQMSNSFKVDSVKNEINMQAF